jgi:hypothetical protein
LVACEQQPCETAQGSLLARRNLLAVDEPV